MFRRIVETPAYRFAALGLIVIAALVLIFGRGGGPSERHRVTHPAGYSIIPPSGWETRVEHPRSDQRDLDRISAFPERYMGPSPNLRVARLRHRPTEQFIAAEGFVSGSFQGQPAWISERTQRRFLVIRLIFQRDRNWFDITLGLPGIEGAKKDEYWQFLDTFRITPEVTTELTTLDAPATAPSTTPAPTTAGTTAPAP